MLFKFARSFVLLLNYLSNSDVLYYNDIGIFMLFENFTIDFRLMLSVDSALLCPLIISSSASMITYYSPQILYRIYSGALEVAQYSLFFLCW